MATAEFKFLNPAARDSAWYALYTRHQHEKTVARVLQGKGFGIFLPLYTSARHWKDRTKQLSLPLFPCYVFVHGDAYRRAEVLSTPGVYSLVGTEGHPAPISEAEIDAVRQMVESKAQVEPCPYLHCGDWIRVKSGPLEGIEGILIRKKNLFRLVVSVELLQKSVAVEVDVSTVERANRPGWPSAAATGSRIHASF